MMLYQQFVIMRIRAVFPGAQRGTYLVLLDQRFPWESMKDLRRNATHLRVVNESDTTWRLLDYETQHGHLLIEGSRIPRARDRVEWITRSLKGSF
jgi:hypothetical protein